MFPKALNAGDASSGNRYFRLFTAIALRTAPRHPCNFCTFSPANLQRLLSSDLCRDLVAFVRLSLTTKIVLGSRTF
jgi:hypothetical protein